MTKEKNKVYKRRYKKYLAPRFVVAILVTILKVLLIILAFLFTFGGLVLLSEQVVKNSMLFYQIAIWIVRIAIIIRIVSTDDNPDYKVPWLLFVMLFPVFGTTFYLLFASRKIKKKYIRKLGALKTKSYERNDDDAIKALKEENVIALNQATAIIKTAETHVFANTLQEYYPSGEAMLESMLFDLKRAKTFIFMEYFIIEQGYFWDSILEVLKQKVEEGLEVKVVYDDIGCMRTLPGNYHKKLKKFGIKVARFSKLRGAVDSEFNNRSHRKIMVIDGYIGYTGGINIADEYINKHKRFGHWKDTAIRLEGEAVWELTKTFLIDYGINVNYIPKYPYDLFPKCKMDAKGYVIPFGDGPNPLYKQRVGKCVIQNMLASAVDYVYMTTPYLIIDNDLCQDIENTALRGVDVRIIVPRIPDKKLVFELTRSYYKRLMKAGVKIYEYELGFVHAKSYIADDKYAMIGTINLDYRSLVHHFENAVWMYDCESIEYMKKDVDDLIKKSIPVNKDMLEISAPARFMRSILRIFAPLM